MILVFFIILLHIHANHAALYVHLVLLLQPSVMGAYLTIICMEPFAQFVIQPVSNAQEVRMLIALLANHILLTYQAQRNANAVRQKSI